MGVDVPELDDRGYTDILADARKRIPVHAPEWTDHNAHDPGITILETLAWVAEAARYRLDQVTERHVLKYLWLLGVRPSPPTPASVELRLHGPGGDALPSALDGMTIPAGERLVATDDTGEPVVFETTEPVTLSVADLAAIESAHREGTADQLESNRAGGVHYLAFGPVAERGSTLTLGFTSDPFANATKLDLSVRLYEADLPPVSAHEVDETFFEPSVELVWEYYATADDGGRWRPLEVVRDETMRFYRGGRITVHRPQEWSPGDWRPRRAAGRSDGRDEAGDRPTESIAGQSGGTVKRAESTTGVVPPTSRRPDSVVADEARSLVGLRCRVSTPGYEIPPRIDRIEVNAVEARNRFTRTETVLRRPDGGVETTAFPNQTYVFSESPVLSAEIALVAGRGDGERRDRWTEVADFDASGPDDTHYVLDGERGEVRFGDNVRGAVPPVGRRVLAETSIHGGGSKGNVPQTAVWAFAPDEGAADERTADAPWRTRATVTPVGSATGASDAESIDAAVARLQRDLRTPYRAVTVDDYRYLAEHTPGIRVSRAAARVLPSVGPDGSDVTRVTVLPYSTLPNSVDPEPSRGVLTAVERHLEKHRLLTDRVEVSAPRYVDIGVTVDARIVPGYSIAGRTRAIEAALDAFLDPQHGFEGTGWPFGRSVYKSELYGVVKEVSGVDWVIDVSVHADGHEGVDEEGNVLIDESALVRPVAHDVSVQFRSETTGVNP